MAAFQRPWHAGHTSRYQPPLEEEAGRSRRALGWGEPGLAAGTAPAAADAPLGEAARLEHTQLSGIEAKPVLPPSTRHSLPGQGKGAQGSSSARPGPAALRLGLQQKSLLPCARDGSTPRTCLERSRQCLLLLNQALCLLFQTKRASHSYFIQAASALKSLQASTHSGDLAACVSGDPQERPAEPICTILPVTHVTHLVSRQAALQCITRCNVSQLSRSFGYML